MRDLECTMCWAIDGSNALQIRERHLIAVDEGAPLTLNLGVERVASVVEPVPGESSCQRCMTPIFHPGTLAQREP